MDSVRPIEEGIPWYNDIKTQPPFELESRLMSESKKPFRAVACFPWKVQDIDTLFNGEFSSDPKMVSQWREFIKSWTGFCAVGGEGRMRVILTRPEQPYLSLLSVKTPKEATVRSVAWCIVTKADSGFWPLISFAADAVLYVYNVAKGEFHGVMRGHGGNINALAVHPIDPSILLSASSDHTCRIYDLRETVECPIENPCWPGMAPMALAGPAFGMRVNDGEGFGLGRCIATLTGVISGGHQAPVLGAAFHRNYPIIATCGMDRTIKLWRMPGCTGRMIHREDRPIFSTAHLHDAQVLSISWLNDDTLVSHSGPIITRQEEIQTKPLYNLPGTLVIWRWLSLERFFPRDRTHYPPILKGNASDHQESASFKILSEYKLPLPKESVQAHVFTSKDHSPLILFPGCGMVRVSSIKDLIPRNGLKFPDVDEELITPTSHLNIRASPKYNESMRFLPCWSIEIDKDSRRESTEWSLSQEEKLPKLEACTMEENGKLLIGVGAKEGIWIWRIPEGLQCHPAQDML